MLGSGKVVKLIGSFIWEVFFFFFFFVISSLTSVHPFEPFSIWTAVGFEAAEDGKTKQTDPYSR